MRKLKSIVANICTFQNVVGVYVAKISGKGLSLLRLWNGARFAVLNTNNNLGTILEVFYAREYRDAEELRSTETPTVIDIGANIGVFTVWVARILPSARVYAYEPEQSNFSLLSQNMSLNGIADRTFVFRNAVCGEGGERTLSIAGESSGKNSLSYDMGTGILETVQAITLNDIFETNKIMHCDCIKIDCEGAEYEILYNTKPEYLACTKMLIVEYHAVPNESYEKLKVFLEKAGFMVTHSPKFLSMFTARRV